MTVRGAQEDAKAALLCIHPALTLAAIGENEFNADLKELGYLPTGRAAAIALRAMPPSHPPHSRRIGGPLRLSAMLGLERPF